MEELLKAATKASYARTGDGLLLTATAGNGHSNTYTIPDSLTPTDVAELISELRDRLEEAQAALGDDATDDQLYTEMMARLVAVRSLEFDFSGIRSSRDSAT